MLDRHHQSIRHQRLTDLRAHGPTHHASGMQIQQHRQVQHPLTGRDKGDVADPDTIRLRCLKIPVQQVRRRWFAVGGCGNGACGWLQYRGVAANGLPGAATDLAGRTQGLPGLHRTVGVARGQMNLTDAR